MMRVLLIHPDHAERDRLALALRRAMHSVRSAPDAAGGLLTAREWSPDVVILPARLTGPEGSDMCETLRALPGTRQAGVIALLEEAADASPAEEREHSPIRAALLAGADDALPAPVSEEDLRQAVAARARRAARAPSVPADPSDETIDALDAALARCHKPATVALVSLRDAHALAAVEGLQVLADYASAWRARVHALACDAAGVFSTGPCEVALLLPPSTPNLRPLLVAIAGTGQIPIRAGTTEYRARAAVGTTVVEPGQPTPPAATLLQQCRFALDRARTAGHPAVHAYDPAEAQATLNDLALATHIQRAAEQGHFQLVYQPVVAIPTGLVIGVEALIRWNMPTGESVPPQKLLRVADEAGLLDEVGTWALREACRQTAQWTQEGMRLTVRVNAAGGQFRRGDFVDEARMALSESGLQGEQLLVEVSEAILARDLGSIRDQLAQVRVAGIRVSLEDVGAGALAASTLRTLPLDEIKIDRSLVEQLPGNAQDRAAVDLVLREARDLNLPCVAEGVEHAAQWAYLAERGWTAGQGFLISMPLPPEAVGVFVAQAEARARAAEEPTR